MLAYNELMKKVTMQMIADQLSVSRVTVWKALSGRPGVAEELRAKIIQKAEECGYRTFAEPVSAGVSAPKAPVSGQVRVRPLSSSSQERLTIAVVAARPESSLFWMSIVHEIAAEASLLGADLMYINVPSGYHEGYALPYALHDGSVSGIIIINVYDEAMLRLINTLAIPKVFLDTMPSIPITDLSGDLVLIEGRVPERLITRSLLDRGFRRIGFIGDISCAQTYYDRYLGYLDAFRETGLIPDPGLSATGSLTITREYEELGAFLDSLTSSSRRLNADGFVCASDFLAQFIRQYCDAHNITTERGLILTGFDNSTEYSNIAGKITTVDVKGSFIGARLANKLLFRISHPGTARELSYVSTEVIFRS